MLGLRIHVFALNTHPSPAQISSALRVPATTPSTIPTAMPVPLDNDHQWAASANCGVDAAPKLMPRTAKPLATVLTAMRGVSILVLALLATLAQAANYPCSGSKGGVAHCAGTRFVCNDGSISGSKRICSAGDAAAPAIRPLITNTSQADGSCQCRSKRYCTGPRGGRYCLSDSGKKSYLRD